MAEQQLPPPDELRERAIKRRKRRHDFFGHLLVNGFQALIRAGS